MLIYAADPNSGERHIKARQLLARAADRDVVLTQQVIGEMLSVGRKCAPAEQHDVRETAAAFAELFRILPTSVSILFVAFERATRFQIQFWDAVIVSVCIAHGVTHLLTEDMHDGLIMDGLTLINPFKPDNAHRLNQLLPEER